MHTVCEVDDYLLLLFAACKAVVDEIRYSVGKVSPHKTYQVHTQSCSSL